MLSIDQPSLWIVISQTAYLPENQRWWKYDLFLQPIEGSPTTKYYFKCANYTVSPFYELRRGYQFELVSKIATIDGFEIALWLWKQSKLEQTAQK